MDILGKLLLGLQHACLIACLCLAVVDAVAAVADDNPQPSYARMKTCLVSFIAYGVLAISKKILSLF